MSGEEDLRGIVKRIESIATEVHDRELDLEETTLRVGDAVALYRKLRDMFEKAPFEVRALRSGREEAFDWESLA